MFDIGWSELLVIAVVALIAIGPKELPGVLRTIGQWMGKARRMAAEFQGHFNEAMREAEMADLKKSFDEVRDATSGLTRGNLMTRLTDSLGEPPKLEDFDKPSAPANSASVSGSAAPEAGVPETLTQTDTGESASGPLVITPEVQGAAPVEPPAAAPETPHEAGRDETIRDAKAS
jgi:sec-independent protein translocase protein TatB